MKKHWTSFLPWVGRPIKEKGEEIQSLENKITCLQMQIERLRRDINIMDWDLLTEVKQNWNTKEIIEAREKASKQ